LSPAFFVVDALRAAKEEHKKEKKMRRVLPISDITIGTDDL